MRLSNFVGLIKCVLLGLLGPLVVACDPCSGVVACGDEPGFRYEGEIQLKFTGEPAAGVRVEFVRVSGISLGRDTIAAQTDSSGHFSLVGRPSGRGEVQGFLIVYPSGKADPVRVPMTLAASRSNADVTYLGTLLIPHLYFGSYGELFYRGGPLYVTNGVFARGVEVEFRRTGGIRVDPDTFVVQSNGAAQFFLEPHPLERGEVIFELVIRPPAPYLSRTVANLRMSTRDTAQTGKTLAARAGLGPHLPYVGVLVFADTQRPASGVEVEFRRTGGIRLAEETYRTTVNESGNFHLGPVPLEAGTVVADLTVRPPAPYRSITITGVRLQTVENDVQLVPAGRWEIPRT